MTRTSRPLAFSASLLALAATVSGCAVGPNYSRPSAPISTAFKEADGWKQAQPSDILDRGQWWTVFNDPLLNALEAKVEVSNQNLIAAEAAYRQARALVAQERSALFPTVDLTGSATRSKSASGTGFTTGGTGTNTGTGTGIGTGTGTGVGTGTGTGTGVGTDTTTTVVSSNSGKPTNEYDVHIGATWEPDVWGGIRRSIESAKASAQASAGDLANAKLSAQIELAADYVQMRALDEEKRLTDQTVVGYAKTLTITQNRYNVGVAARSDLLTAQTNMQTAQAQAVDLLNARAQMEHAIAVLTGQPPAALTLALAPWSLTPPALPVGLPSNLLERRPDVAAAERRMASANAQIGVNVAGYFPALTLSGSDGFGAAEIGHLFSAAANSWSIGANVAQTIFDAGLNRAKVRQARAVYDQNVALYRQTVLTALQQVEDSIAASRVLEAELQLRNSASKEADEAEQIVFNQYKAGQVDQTTLVVAQATAATARITAVQVASSRLVASIDLISALGGGWHANQLAAK
jgi:NodT family efflux transporter outer membrane factor (OMF) lipoprotein